jgi:hypothetical protein
MRTTVSISDPLLRDAKILAAKNGSSLSAVVEEGLRTLIQKSNSQIRDDRRPPLVISTGGGLMPGIDLSNNAQLADLMDETDALDRRERLD